MKGYKRTQRWVDGWINLIGGKFTKKTRTVIKKTICGKPQGRCFTCLFALKKGSLMGEARLVEMIARKGGGDFVQKWRKG